MSENSAAGSIISADVEIIGTIKTSKSIRIDGTIDGDLQAGGDVFIGKTAQLKGNIQVTSVSIGGNIDGNVKASDRVELKSTARIKGDIHAQRLSMEDGVAFSGHVQVTPKGTPSSRGGSSASVPPPPKAEPPKAPAGKA